MEARRPWLLAVTTWLARHRRRWRRRHLHAVDGGTRRTLADAAAARPARDPKGAPRSLRTVEQPARWLPQPQWNKPRPDDPEPGAA